MTAEVQDRGEGIYGVPRSLPSRTVRHKRLSIGDNTFTITIAKGSLIMLITDVPIRRGHRLSAVDALWAHRVVGDALLSGKQSRVSVRDCFGCAQVPSVHVITVTGRPWAPEKQSRIRVRACMRQAQPLATARCFVGRPRSQPSLSLHQLRASI